MGSQPFVTLYSMDHHVLRYIQKKIEGVKLALSQLSTQGTMLTMIAATHLRQWSETTAHSMTLGHLPLKGVFG